MICPYCQTDNRDDREACYYCKKDLSMLRLIVNKAKHHYNQGLEYAERGRLDDAIGELKNALDLDGTMDNAHVVLGTLYAKKEMFPEARECWKRALAVNHNLNKAHEYLDKAEKAEYVFPAIHRLKFIALTLGVLCAISLIAALWLGRAITKQDPDLEQVHQVALKLKEDNNKKLGALYSELVEVGNRKTASPVARDLAQGINRFIWRGWQGRLDLASRNSRSFNSFGAFQILESLREEEASRIPEVQQSIDRLTSTSQENSIQRINDSYKQFLNERLPYERFEMETGMVARFIRDEDARREIEKLKAAAQAIETERLRNEAMDVILNGEIVKAVRAVSEAEARDAKAAEPLRQAMAQRLAAENARATAEIGNLIDLKQFDRALARIEQYKLLCQAAAKPLSAAQIQAFAAKVQEGRRKAAHEETLAAFAARDWEKFLDLTKTTQTLAGDAVEAARLNVMRQEATEKQRREALAWFAARETKFKENTLSADDATTAVRTYPAALAGLGANSSVTTAGLSFGLAQAHLKLGQPAPALELLKALVAKYPKASQAKAATALIKKLEPAPAQTPESRPEPSSGVNSVKPKRGEGQSASGSTTRRRSRSGSQQSTKPAGE